MSWTKNRERGLPAVIAGVGLDCEEMIQLKALFSQNGYYAVVLQKNPIDENVIPLGYYDDSI